MVPTSTARGSSKRPVHRLAAPGRVALAEQINTTILLLSPVAAGCALSGRVASLVSVGDPGGAGQPVVIGQQDQLNLSPWLERVFRDVGLSARSAIRARPYLVSG